MDIESQQMIPSHHPYHTHPKWLKWVPVTALCVSIYSAFFSTFILYPWHQELSREFTELKTRILSCQP